RGSGEIVYFHSGCNLKLSGAAVNPRDSSLRAGTTRHCFVPSREILERGIQRDAHQLHDEIDRDLAGDIRDGKAIARDERLVADLRVEPLQLLFDSLTLRRRVFRNLLDARLEQFARMLERSSGGAKQVQLDSPVPHLDERL